MGKPTPKALIEMAMKKETPPRVPVMCQMAVGHVVLNADVHPIDFFMKGETFAKGLLEMRERYQFDGILIHKPGREPDFAGLIDRIDRELDEPTIYLKDGNRIECMRDDDPYFRRKEEGLLHPEIEALDPDDPFGWASETFLHWCHHKGTIDVRETDGFPEYYYSTIDMILKEVGDEYSVHGEVRAPMDHFFMAGGIENCCMSLLDCPDHAHKLMNTFADLSTVWAVAQIKRGCHAIKISSPFAGAAFLSPDMYEEWIVPYERRIAGGVRAAGGYTYTHTCGAIGDRLHLMAASGIDGVETLDPPPLGTVELDEAKALLKDKLFIKGNIDPVNGLLRNDVAGARKEIERVHDIGVKGGQFILSTACSIAPPTPPENIELMAEVVRQRAEAKNV